MDESIISNVNKYLKFPEGMHTADPRRMSANYCFLLNDANNESGTVLMVDNNAEQSFVREAW